MWLLLLFLPLVTLMTAKSRSGMTNSGNFFLARSEKFWVHIVVKNFDFEDDLQGIYQDTESGPHSASIGGNRSRWFYTSPTTFSCSFNRPAWCWPPWGRLSNQLNAKKYVALSLNWKHLSLKLSLSIFLFLALSDRLMHKLHNILFF